MFIICFCTGLHLELWTCNKELDWAIWENSKSFNFMFQSLPSPSPLTRELPCQLFEWSWKSGRSLWMWMAGLDSQTPMQDLEHSLICLSGTHNLTCLIFLDFVKRASVISPSVSPQPMWGETQLLWILAIREKCRWISAKKPQPWKAVSILYEGSRYLKMQVWGPVLHFFGIQHLPLYSGNDYTTPLNARNLSGCLCDSADQVINIPYLKM